MVQIKPLRSHTIGIKVSKRKLAQKNYIVSLANAFGARSTKIPIIAWCAAFSLKKIEYLVI